MIPVSRVLAPAALLLTLALAGCASATPARPAQELQAEAFDLWNAGEFESAAAAFQQLAERSDDEPLARTALFHLGSLLESDGVMEAELSGDVRDILSRAEDAYRSALERADPARPRAADQIRHHLALLEANQARLTDVLAGRLPPVEAAETLDDLNAPGAAAAYLAPLIDSGKARTEQFHFLSLVYLLAYVDQLHVRLARAVPLSQTEGGPVGPTPSARERMARQERALQRAEVLADFAIAHFPGSAHEIDFRLHAGDFHRYHGALELRRAEWAEEGPHSAVAAAHRAEARRHFEQFEMQARLVEEFTDAALKDRSLLSPAQANAYPDSVLDAYLEMARETLGQAAALLGPSGPVATH